MPHANLVRVFIQSLLLLLSLTQSSCVHLGEPNQVGSGDCLVDSRQPASEGQLSAQEQQCVAALRAASRPPELVSLTPRIETQIERQFAYNLPPLGYREQLTLEIEELRKVDPTLAQEALAARRSKMRGESLKIDISHLPGPMVYFIEGIFQKVVGNRGVSRPFMDIRAIDESTLLLQHKGDQYPLLIQWDSQVTELHRATEENRDGVIYRVLKLPASLTSKQDLNLLPEKYIYSLISGSALNRYISSQNSLIIRVASLLHDEKLVFDRPTQQDYKSLRDLLDGDESVREKVKSLLFVAPTASGKTRVLLSAVLNKISFSEKRLSEERSYKKKLTILMTKTPDLTSDLAREIGKNLYSSLGPKRYRIVQWGGDLTEKFDFKELMRFVDDSAVPVVLVSSYPTLGARIKASSDMNQLFDRANSLLIDEAHNTGGETFKRVFSAATEVALRDRQNHHVRDSLDILGVTASPVTRDKRTVELFDGDYWALLETPKGFARKLKSNAKSIWTGAHKDVLEWIRIIKQYSAARDRGEINAPDHPIFYDPAKRGFNFSSVFKRVPKGTAWSVDHARLEKIWPDIQSLVEGHGPGIIQTYPRDAQMVTQVLSQLTGKNFVSLQGVTAEAREDIYQAFREQTEYQGKVVDGIVGTIREGLDFPKAGWFLSFIKYVKFPDSLQGPGRVVRLDHNKLPPVIIYFGEELDRMAYKDVRELVLQKLGRLPGGKSKTRLYKGARKRKTGKPLDQIIEDLNVALEALVRIQYQQLKNASDPQNISEENVTQVQNAIRKLRSSQNRSEIGEAIDSFIFEMHSYRFFKGTLKSTWKYCDKLINIEKKGQPYPQKGLSNEDLRLLQDSDGMALVREFREMYSTIGAVPRALIEDYAMTLNNLSDLAQAVDVYLANNEALPETEDQNPHSLGFQMKKAIQTSPEAFWRRLGFHARVALDNVFQETKNRPIEFVIEEYYKSYGILPEFKFEGIENSEHDIEDGIAKRISDRMESYLFDGTLDLNALSEEVLRAIDSSELYQRSLAKTLAALKVSNEELVTELGLENYDIHQFLTFDLLSHYEPFQILQVVNQMAKRNLPQSIEWKNEFDQALISWKSQQDE